MSALAARFAAEGRLHIDNFLAPDGAEGLHALLRASAEWRRVFNQGDRVFELDRDAQAQLTPEKRSALEQAIHNNARYDFQYAYEVIRVVDAKRAGASAMTCFPLRHFLELTRGDQRLSYDHGGADHRLRGRSSHRVRPRPFPHSARRRGGGKAALRRLCLRTNPRWRTEWGGLLLFTETMSLYPARGVQPSTALTCFAFHKHTASVG